jgi:photosystem II stability/assembly factor-like uncharacterized protein
LVHAEVPGNWIPMSADINAYHFDIDFFVGDPTRTGTFRVQVLATDDSGRSWSHKSSLYSPMFPEWSTLFLGMRTPEAEADIPAVVNSHSIEWMTSLAFDNFVAFGDKPRNSLSP